MTAYAIKVMDTLKRAKEADDPSVGAFEFYVSVANLVYRDGFSGLDRLIER